MSENKLLLIGRGCNSQLYAYGEGENRVVLKVVSEMCKKEQTHLKNQYLMLKSLEHQGVIKALRYQQKVAFQRNKMDKQLTYTNSILVLEYAQQGSLLHYIQKHQLDIHQKRSFFRSIVEAVAYLHQQGIAHRDLKLENILVSLQNGQVGLKISDFGFASHFQREGKLLNFKEFKGTRKGYMAPEIHQCQHDRGKQYNATKCDIFALGVILFALVLGKLPFEYAVEENKLYKLIIDKKYKDFWAFHHQINQVAHQQGFRVDQFQELIEKMLSYEASERPTAEEVLKCSWII